jgi:hypothetical protein
MTWTENTEACKQTVLLKSKPLFYVLDITRNWHTNQPEASRMGAFYVSMSALKAMPFKD